MNRIPSFITMVLVCTAMPIVFASCGNSTPPNTADQKTAATSDTVAKPRWVNPQNGKIYGKVNVVQIPLTAIENHIFGPVKSVRYVDYKIDSKDGSRTLDDSGYNVYDKFGHLVDQNEYDKNGKVKWHCVYTYDDQNKAVKWDFKFADGHNSVTTFQYDEKGRQTESNEVAVDKKRSRRVVYKYDEKGNLLEEADYWGSDKQARTTTYQYDNRGYQVSLVWKDATGKVLRKTTQEYDNNGNSTNGVYYTSDTAISYISKAKLDNLGRDTETAYYESDGTTLQSTSKYKFDEWDNITEYATYKADGTMDTARFNEAMAFEYDSHGNAVKETWYKVKDGKRIMTDVAERIYEYY